jgi:hypothetical protein
MLLSVLPMRFGGTAPGWYSDVLCRSIVVQHLRANSRKVNLTLFDQANGRRQSVRGTRFGVFISIGRTLHLCRRGRAASS